MVQARIVNEVKSVEVRAENQETSVRVRSESESTRVGVKSNIHHDDLTDRDLPDQHPIDAITGLAEALQEVSDKSFVFEQSIASDTWHIQHTLNKQASCFAVDSSGNVQIPNEIRYVSDNEIIVTFLAPFAGKAYLN